MHWAILCKLHFISWFQWAQFSGCGIQIMVAVLVFSVKTQLLLKQQQWHFVVLMFFLLTVTIKRVEKLTEMLTEFNAKFKVVEFFTWMCIYMFVRCFKYGAEQRRWFTPNNFFSSTNSSSILLLLFSWQYTFTSQVNLFQKVKISGECRPFISYSYGYPNYFIFFQHWPF